MRRRSKKNSRIIEGLELLSLVGGSFSFEKKNWLRILLVIIKDFTFCRTPKPSLTPCSRGVRIGVWMRQKLGYLVQVENLERKVNRMHEPELRISNGWKSKLLHEFLFWSCLFGCTRLGAVKYKLELSISCCLWEHWAIKETRMISSGFKLVHVCSVACSAVVDLSCLQFPGVMHD